MMLHLALSPHVRGTDGLGDILTRDSSNDIVKAPVKVAVDLAALWIAGRDIFLGSNSNINVVKFTTRSL